MTLRRITRHPILDIPENKKVTFTWNGKKLTGYEGEMISSALFANGIQIFGHHPKDNSPQGAPTDSAPSVWLLPMVCRLSRA
jgi:hypothetical protein